MAGLPHGLESRKSQYWYISNGLALESSGFSSLVYSLVKYLRVDFGHMVSTFPGYRKRLAPIEADHGYHC